MQGNGLLKVLVPLFLALALAIVVMWPSSDSDHQQTQQGSLDKKDPSLTLSQDELKALGIEGDTPEDTVATLVGQTRAMREDMNRILDANDKLREQNQELAERNDNVDGRIRSALRDQQQDFTRERRQNQRENQSLLNNLQGQIRNLKEGFTGDGGDSGDDDMPIGLGLEGGGGPTGSYGGGGNLAWVEPMDQRQESGRGGSRRDEGPAFPTSFKAAASDVGDAASRANSAIKASATGQPDEATVEPVYTIPENSTLMGSLAMTALLGRVPVDGTVNDPYPFKVMIGKDNLTANGIELPEVRAAVASGTATGDWTLSCVRGNITSLTFVFEDGTIRTVPSPVDVNQGGGGNDNRSNQNQTIGGGDSIGWISDQAGLPCISGMRRSNAQQYLGTQGLLTAAGAGAATMLSDDDSTSITSFGSDGSISQAMSGNQAVGQILSQGVNDMSEWVNKLYGEAFAAVYVPPGQNVAIHINKQLPIDYETEGRKVRYDTSTATTVGLD
ncbi:TIGR03752 family integrating conjugative element protein [Salinicola sp. JS01]|uniref:TIGR03752 family integrating conjugative element protein n=1 Tax=Salinicola sp. JS01 TaxID=3050071 RepID=UPI00255C0B43|nr:TIGR03752 family integrating conjugative element protein [Salinicola sp. JS01]WIX34969.1 TIGR03752 family integrating conjugative element protein [Salinicola sp. JS01]